MHDTSPERRGWCVVVADDDSDWRALMTRALRRGGYTVAEASDGEELVAHCRSVDADGEYCLIVVSDIDMPGCNGIQATLALRSMHIDAPVLLVTGTQSSNAVEAAWEAGARAILYKPVRGAQVVALVNLICERDY